MILCASFRPLPLLPFVLTQADNFPRFVRLPIPLPKRVEYLSLAVGNAKSQFPSAGQKGDAVQFLTACEEKLEVAQVQIEIFRALEEAPDLGPEERENVLGRLGVALYTISEVSSVFGEVFGLGS